MLNKKKLIDVFLKFNKKNFLKLYSFKLNEIEHVENM